MAFRAWKGPYASLTPLEVFSKGVRISASHSTGGGTPTTVAYSADSTTNFLNPERGWMKVTSYKSPLPNYRGDGVTVAWTSTYEGSIFRLDAFRNSAISATRLQDIREWFDVIRTSGLKAKVRFSYNGNPMPENPEDASETRILEHIGQLTPILQDYEDVIAMLDAGFIGKWGEWHSSSNGLTDNTSASRQARLNIHNALLNALPQTRMVGQRYPYYIREFYPEGEVYTGFEYNNEPYPTDYTFNSAERFDGSGRSRTGWLNDCFIANKSNTGTYSTWDAPQPERFELDRSTFEAIGPYTVASGETCGSSLNEYNDGPAAIAEMETMHGPDLLNEEYSTTIYNSWTQAEHDQITRRLGYRIGLVEATLPTEVTPNTVVQLSLTLQNTGFGKLYNPRPLELVFVGESTYVATLESDCRRKMPLGGQTVTNTFSFTVPAGLLNGETYALHLRLPDAAPNLSSDVRYMIRLANTGTWDAGTGYNSLQHSVTVGTSSS